MLAYSFVILSFSPLSFTPFILYLLYWKVGGFVFCFLFFNIQAKYDIDPLGHTNSDFFSFLLLYPIHLSCIACWIWVNKMGTHRSCVRNKYEWLQPKGTEMETAVMGCCYQVILFPFLSKSTPGDGSLPVTRWLSQQSHCLAGSSLFCMQHPLETIQLAPSGPDTSSWNLSTGLDSVLAPWWPALLSVNLMTHHTAPLRTRLYFLTSGHDCKTGTIRGTISWREMGGEGAELAFSHPHRLGGGGQMEHSVLAPSTFRLFYKTAWDSLPLSLKHCCGCHSFCLLRLSAAEITDRELKQDWAHWGLSWRQGGAAWGLYHLKCRQLTVAGGERAKIRHLSLKT